MKARGRLVVAVVVLCAFAIPAAASARTNLHPRHIEFRQPTSRAFVNLGEHDGYEFGISFAEPDYAILSVERFDPETQAGTSTTYGDHFEGSLWTGRVRARFGGLGSISLRFVADGNSRSRPRSKNCEGRPRREEEGHFVGSVSLRGEGDYSALSMRRAAGSVSRTFRLRCRVKHLAGEPPATSLQEWVNPLFSLSFSSARSSLALLAAGDRHGGRIVDLIAAHEEGAPAGAEVTAIAFEYQGKMPVGRSAWATESPAGTLLTSLPGEHPATAILKPASPFSGEAAYLATSPTSHSWTGDLAVQFPGLSEPLAGPDFYSWLCVVSPLRSRYGCDSLPPDWQMAE